ncbi:related to rRNA methyltransferase, mitochondrial [Saccharomycodes ludwigii]|uniref:Related to rRNA methyltransferase, mitochondrial n=1 Tax=Saccharomycodes ludwigii TaxID=36035 RepID=A0A376BAM9_9ASCO|nr:hypothetical protein SCDLUD_002125 [Saccharomycodes ludwigii]KAH3902305.1 hypothetical protein SCDLUD_002125 [Saccharomycodes ludwigii]SSD61604.1 related to rRNA methyltransferase, mitochondrial [Saccharomycodes ludwigii]
MFRSTLNLKYAIGSKRSSSTPISKGINIEKLLPRNQRIKAWERTGESKEVYFKRKHAHQHAKEKAKKLEVLTEQRTKFNQYNFRKTSSKKSDTLIKRAEKDVNPFFDYIYGTNAVRAALLCRPALENKRLLYYKELSPEFVKLCNDKGIPTTLVEDKTELDKLCNNIAATGFGSGKLKKSVHNNIVLECKKYIAKEIDTLPKVAESLGEDVTVCASTGLPFSYYETNEENRNDYNVTKVLQNVLINGAKDHPVGLYLDEIQDPHNMGAILRSAYYLGCDFVVVSHKNCCSVSNGIVRKVSSGATELLPIFTTSKPLKFLSSSQQNGWVIVSGDLLENANKFTRNKFVDDAEEINKLKLPVLLVVGNEGDGIRTQLKKLSDFFITIPFNNTISKRNDVIDSLNVSVATALLLNNLCK